MNCLQKLMLFSLLILVIWLKKAEYEAKTEETEKKIPNQDIYITIKKNNKLTKENFAERLKQAKLATNTNLANIEQRAIENKKDKAIKHILVKVTLAMMDPKIS